VVVERVIPNGSDRGVNYYTLPGRERMRGLAPKCVGTFAVVADNTDAIPKIKRKPTPAHKAEPAVTTKLAPASHELFMALAKSASTRAGWVLSDGSVQITASQRGTLNYLKRLGLITIKKENKRTWVGFSDEGMGYASLHGVDINWMKIARM
jgi:hypothetical protein